MAINLFDLTGRRALVTGSSQGIGFALARGLSEAGAEVVLNGRDEAKLAAAASSIAGARTLAFDATDHAAARAAVDRFEADIGPIDILVNNAGMQHRAPLEDFPADAFQRLLQTNIASVFNVGQACARHMIARGAGKIINIASVQTALARPSIAPYTATKGAVGNLTKGMATDWAKHGLQVNAHRARLFRYAAQCRAGRGSRVLGLARKAHAGGPLGQGRGTRRRLRLPRLGRVLLRQRTRALCRRRHHGLALRPYRRNSPRRCRNAPFSRIDRRRRHGRRDWNSTCRDQDPSPGVRSRSCEGSQPRRKGRDRGHHRCEGRGRSRRRDPQPQLAQDRASRRVRAGGRCRGRAEGHAHHRHVVD